MVLPLFSKIKLINLFEANCNKTNVLTKCIKNHAKAGILSTAEQDEGAAELKQSLMASLYNNLN